MVGLYILQIILWKDSRLLSHRISRGLPHSSFLLDDLPPEPRLQSFAHPSDLILAGEENEDTSRREPRVNLNGLANCLVDVIRLRLPVEVNSDRVLASRYLDDRWRDVKQSLVLREVRYPQSC